MSSLDNSCVYGLVEPNKTPSQGKSVVVEYIPKCPGTCFHDFMFAINRMHVFDNSEVEKIAYQWAVDFANKYNLLKKDTFTTIKKMKQKNHRDATISFPNLTHSFGVFREALTLNIPALNDLIECKDKTDGRILAIISVNEI